MRISLLLLSFVLLSFPVTAQSRTAQEIELTDGSIIRAEIVSMQNGVYRLRSSALGEFDVPETKVRMIRAEGTPSQPSPLTAPASPVPQASPSRSAEDLQQALTQDPAAMEKIRALQNDPAMQSILSDPETMQAIHSGDLGALMSNPKIRALMEHPTVRDLGEQYGK